ncbi:MAG: hypothetical protein K6D97_04300 [Clostridia bacterium]|nr:hypothetical protein [Clostridia bacterium]
MKKFSRANKVTLIVLDVLYLVLCFLVCISVNAEAKNPNNDSSITLAASDEIAPTNESKSNHNITQIRDSLKKIDSQDDTMSNVEITETFTETSSANTNEIAENIIETDSESNIIVDEDTQTDEQESYVWDGPVLNSYVGVVYGPSGKETYYNLPMGGVIDIMRSIGFDEESYPYWVRDDGCKMLGDYIMVAADLSIRPRGSLIECSLGTAIVCDTGTFIYDDPNQLDIAVTW